ncbi:hypothetical protein GYMLUDRAFT_172741 [Collybiopsis luxurians FD-317 M1]|uniref:Uncharacterized protein n=1 Tax=Collybiopsis luxurians FD-317 M1 TaxID=944289 RepID=A0A0D0C580_9AGAR|nr:hypothetical protein GYMLUDRAFT_172741 [Collybiopsis luxurians FD-317 M1]
MALTSAFSSLSPSEQDLKDTLISLKLTRRILKIHALLLEAHPEWTVHEKQM